MDDKQANILEAAIRVISRYGVKRTTMQDIADEAGVVRQTLYNAYRKKEDVLRATIGYISETARTAVRTGWETADGLSEKLDVFFEHTMVEPFRMAHTLPEADDIISGFSAAAEAEIAREAERNRVLLEQALVPYEADLKRAGMSAAQCADFIQAAGYGLKSSAESEAQLRERLASLKSAVLALIS